MGNTIAIIGGGPSGIIALHDILALLEEKKESGQPCPLEILWYDAKGQFGASDAFATDLSPALSLNGPTYVVRPSAFNRRIFHDFLNAAHGITDLEGHIPRRMYGEFLNDLVHKLDRKAVDLGVRLQKIPKAVVSVQKHAPDKSLFLQEGNTGCWGKADRLIVAPGPPANDVFSHLDGLHGYIKNPARMESFRDSNLDFTDPYAQIVCFGPGNSFFDGLALLEREFGYMGQYTIIAPEERKPWPLTREREIANDVVYKFQHFKPLDFPCPVTLSYLSGALEQDIEALKSPEKNPERFGVEHPLYYIAAFAMEYFKMWEKKHKPDPLARAQSLLAFQDLQKKTAKTLQDVTDPSLIDLYNQVKNEGRIKIFNGRADCKNINNPGKMFRVPVRLNDDGMNIILRSDGIMNCMPFAHDWQRTQTGLLAQMEQDGLVRKKPEGVVRPYDFGHALENGIGLVGAAVDPIWGVHIFAQRIAGVADTFVRQLCKPSAAPPAPSR